MYLSAQQIVEYRPLAFVRHVRHLCAGHLIKEFRGQVDTAPRTGRTVVDLAGIRLFIRDELFYTCHGNRRMQHHQLKRFAEQRNRRYVIDRMVGQLIHYRAGGVTARHDHHRVTVGCGPHTRLDANHATRAGTIVYYNGLLEGLAQPGREQARNSIDRAACRKRRDEAYRLVRVTLCSSHPGSRHAAHPEY